MPAKNSAKRIIGDETDTKPIVNQHTMQSSHTSTSSYRNLDNLRTTLAVSEGTRKSMKANRSKDTKPEMTLRKALWVAGIRGYRKNYTLLAGKPDIYYPRSKLCIFVHGCFWHQCPYCTRNLEPDTNANYWSAKRQKNQDRDARVLDELRRHGYSVLVIWECQLRSGLDALVERVRAMRGREAAAPGPEQS